MNKKGLILVLIIIVSVFMVTGCSKKEEKTSNKVKMVYQTSEGDITFTYPKANSFTLTEKEKDTDEGKVYSTTIYSNDLAIGMDVGLYPMNRDIFKKELQLHEKKKDLYNIKNYKGFVSAASTDAIQFKILIKEKDDSGFSWVLTGTAYYINAPRNEERNITDDFNSKVIRNFFDSMKFKEIERQRIIED